MLDAIPEDLPSQDLCPWLKSVFVPFVRKVIPPGQVDPKIPPFSICFLFFFLRLLFVFSH